MMIVSTRRLDWRSGIASYYIVKCLVPHKYTPVEGGHFYNMDGEVVSTNYHCGICDNCGVFSIEDGESVVVNYSIRSLI